MTLRLRNFLLASISSMSRDCIMYETLIEF